MVCDTQPAKGKEKILTKNVVVFSQSVKLFFWQRQQKSYKGPSCNFKKCVAGLPTCPAFQRAQSPCLWSLRLPGGRCVSVAVAAPPGRRPLRTAPPQAAGLPHCPGRTPPFPAGGGRVGRLGGPPRLQMSGIERSMVWWSRVGDNLDAARRTRTVAQTGSGFPSPLASASPRGAFICMSKTFKSWGATSHRAGRAGRAVPCASPEEAGGEGGREVRAKVGGEQPYFLTMCS